MQKASFWIPILHATGLLLLGAALLWAAFAKSGQMAWPYPLDDSYIHLSISRTLAEQGLWSPVPHRFEFSSSSPLFTLLLACLIRLGGEWVGWPMLLGLLPAAGTIWLLWHHLSGSLLERSLWLWAIVLLTPLHLVQLMGMEHALHGFLCLWWLINWIRDQGRPSWVWVGLSVAMVLARYESLFLMGAAGAWLLWHQQWRSSVVLAVAGLLPLFLLGVYSVSQGGEWLPNSLLMKGHRPAGDLSSWVEWGMGVLDKLYTHPFIFSLLTISAVGAWLGRGLPTGLRAAAWVLQLAAWGHVLFAEIGGYRYEAYLFLTHGLLLALLLKEWGKQITMPWLMAGIWLGIPLMIRSLFFTANYPLAVQNIYHQSVQVGKFLATYYPETPVAMHDIGVATYLGDFPLTDLAAISDLEVYRMYAGGEFTPEGVERLLERRGVKLAVIQQGWMGYVMPPEWRCAGSWTIPDHFIISLPEVFFWAADDTTYAGLVRNLQDYQPGLPEGIVAEGAYMGSPLPEVKTPQ